MISVSFFHVFTVNIEENASRDGVLAHFYRPGGGGFELFFCPGRWGIRPSKKLPGGMVRLGID